MAEATGIEWCDSTFNPFIGCTKVGPGCDNCYAEELMDKRMHIVQWGPGQQRHRTSEKNWKLPVHWNAHPFYACPECGWRGETDSNCPSCAGEVRSARRRVFCASLADVFDNEVDPQWRADLFALIAATPNLDWLLLTKRIGNVATMLDQLAFLGTADSVLDKMPLPNVWLGITVVNQAEADRDIPKLLAVPARVRFLSIEPMLGPIDLTRIDIDGHSEIYPLKGTTGCEDDDGDSLPDIPRVDWVIAGGESGPKARPMHPDWVRSLRNQCAAAGVPFLFKQWGEWAPYDRSRTDGAALATPNALDEPMQHFGKKAAGRLLDGIEHNGYPEVSHG